MRKAPILWSIRKFIGRYPLFHSTCDEETAYIRSVFGNDAEIIQIPNFIEMPPLAERRRQGQRYLLFLGRIHWKKGIANLLEGLSQSREFLASDFILKIAGKGSAAYETELREMVDKLGLGAKVEFVGQVEGAEKQQLLADAEWMVMPSHSENFGIVVLESLAQNTPVIASKGSPWKVLEDEHLGFWTANSADELAKVVGRVVTMTANEYAEYRRGGREFVETNFDIEENIGRWVDAYRGLK